MTGRAPILDRILAMPGVKGRDGQWSMRCPAHEDQSPSLSVATAADGRVLLKCHAGCTVEMIVTALGATMADLYVAAAPPPAPVVHRYQDASGHVIYEKLRYPVGAKQRFMVRVPLPDGSYRPRLGKVGHVLYRLPAVLSAAQARTRIFVGEGEKDVETLESLGLTATTNDGGAGSVKKPKWQESDTDYLRGCSDAIIIPDSDGPGYAHAKSVALSLHRQRIPCRVVFLPGTREGFDVTGWIEQGATLEKLGALSGAA